MAPLTFSMRLRTWLAQLLFVLAGKLDPAYDVWLDDAPRRTEAPLVCSHGKPFDEHCKECEIRGFCGCRECTESA